MTHDDDRGDAVLSSSEDGPADPRSSSVPDPDEAREPSADEPGEDAPAHRAGRAHLPVWQEMGLLLVLAVVLAVVIKAFLVQAFYIPSGSMNDTLVLNDRILVQKVSTWGDRSPGRGDIVVFADPGGWLGPEEQAPAATNPVTRGLEFIGLHPTGGHLVKRVIGVGGDRVKCCDKQGRTTVNGVPLDEGSYLKPGEKPSLITFDVQVPQGHLWVEGDNRSHSADSRVHLGDPGGGMVPVDDVVGTVFSVVWPLGHATLLHRPATFDDLQQALADR